MLYRVSESSKKTNCPSYKWYIINNWDLVIVFNITDKLVEAILQRTKLISEVFFLHILNLNMDMQNSLPNYIKTEITRNRLRRIWERNPNSVNKKALTLISRNYESIKCYVIGVTYGEKSARQDVTALAVYNQLYALR